MSDFKFSCANCGQHLTAGDNWVGRQIKCPACQADIIIPQVATAPLATPKPPAPPSSTPPPLPPLPPPGARNQPVSRTLCLLAVVSLGLSLLTLPLNLLSKTLHFPVGLLGCIPGVICGHLALARLRANRALTGKGFALAGLICGYLFIAVGLVALGFYLVARPALKEARSPRSTPTSTQRPPAPATVPAPAPAQPTAPEPEVSTDPLAATIPSASIAGTLQGQAVALSEATLRGGTLSLRQAKAFAPDFEVLIFLFLGSQDPSGKTLVVPTQSNTVTPHVHLRWKEGGKSQSTVLSRNYVMRLEFGTAAGNRIPGKIYLELPQGYRTKLAGTFEAQLP